MCGERGSQKEFLLELIGFELAVPGLWLKELMWIFPGSSRSFPLISPWDSGVDVLLFHSCLQLLPHAGTRMHSGPFKWAPRWLPHRVQGKLHANLVPVTLRVQADPWAAPSLLSHGASAFPGVSPLDHLTADSGRSCWAAPVTGFEMNEGASPHSVSKMCPHTFSHFVLWLLICGFSLDPRGQRVWMFLCNLLCGDFTSPSLWNWWLYDHHCNWKFKHLVYSQLLTMLLQPRILV